MRGLLVGYGSAGRRHLAHLHALGVTDWTVVRSGRGTVPFAPPCPVRETTDLVAALRAERPGFAVVATPSALHVEAACACAEEGCHLLIEKPLATSLSGLDELERIARKNGCKILLGFQFRGHPALKRLAELHRSGVLGRFLHAELSWGEHLPDWHPWESYRDGYAARADLGGGVHHTLCHPLDLLLGWFGLPCSVTGALTCRGPLGLDVAESADAWLEWPDRSRASIHLDYWRRPGRFRLDWLGTGGTAVWDFASGELQIRHDPEPSPRIERFPGLEAREALFAEQARHFLAVVAGRESPRAGLRDGIEAVRVTLALEESARRGLTLPLPESL